MPDTSIDLDESALEAAARAVHDSWCSDNDCSARDDGQDYLDADLRNARAAITTYLSASESRLAAAEAERDVETVRAEAWRAKAAAAEAVIAAAREVDRLAGSDSSLVDLEVALATYDAATDGAEG